MSPAMRIRRDRREQGVILSPTEHALIDTDARMRTHTPGAFA